MLTDLPSYITILFLLTVALTFVLFINVVKYKAATSIILLIWLALTGMLAYKGVFQNTAALPPRLMLVMAPALLFIILMLATKKGKVFIDNLDLKKLTLVHIIRLPVEVILYLFSLQKLIPELMTFAGRNFDILSGITAPIIYFVCFKNSQLKNRWLLLIWNFVCLGLLLNIVINALLSAPFPFQQFAFDQPNIAVLYFPFIWLPCFIVMIVLFSHLAAISKLLRNNKAI
ncbi:MAG TPA: hypothetical protein VGQ09_09850 [Chitinophagaceae bacterium]|jgi:hypothetical protein|nr:hypothetical protein [Chitinophagaceae bacterium]